MSKATDELIDFRNVMRDAYITAGDLAERSGNFNLAYSYHRLRLGKAFERLTKLYTEREVLRQQVDQLMEEIKMLRSRRGRHTTY